uniref:CSON013331 protein n=1 Tax=Culicoides sonorensis TaxID=179676 RepID=A0A336M7P6_CULSO
MDDMFLQCNKNTIYVLNSTYRYGEFDMIGLFGSAAGRAIVHSNNNSKPFNSNSSHNNSKTNNSRSNNFNKSKTASKAYKSLSNMTAKSKSLDYELIHDQNKRLDTNVNTENTLAKIHNGKKSKFWKIFEGDKDKNSLEDISTASSKNSVSKSNKSTCKSSKELYREAAEILGLSCTLSDNCRCLDCQSGYFDCDDSDSLSDMDMSYMDDFETTNFMLMEDNSTMYDIIEASTQQQQQYHNENENNDRYLSFDDQHKSETTIVVDSPNPIISFNENADEYDEVLITKTESHDDDDATKTHLNDVSPNNVECLTNDYNNEKQLEQLIA